MIDIILICVGGGTIAWAFMWSRRERQRKANAKFLDTLKGVRLTKVFEHGVVDRIMAKKVAEINKEAKEALILKTKWMS